MSGRGVQELGSIFDDLTDDEDFLELVELVAFPRSPSNFRERINHFEKWNDLEFFKRFRLSKSTVTCIVNTIRNDLVCLRNDHVAVSPEDQVLATLRFLATGMVLQATGDFLGVDKSTASRFISNVLNSIAKLGRDHIKMPCGPEINKVKEGFFNISNFPKCIGALDCTHVKIQSPGGENPEYYRNRKGYFSFNVQVVCDSTLKIRDIVCRWPGSCHDSTIFNNSRLRARLESQEFGDSLVVADKGYLNNNYVITPLRNPQTAAEHLFNLSQARTRNPVERCFGVLKKRFPILSVGIRLDSNKVEAIVVTCAVLHNIACEMGEDAPGMDEITQEAMTSIEIDLEEASEVNNIQINNIVRSNLINTYFQGRL